MLSHIFDASDGAGRGPGCLPMHSRPGGVEAFPKCRAVVADSRPAFLHPHRLKEVPKTGAGRYRY